MSDEYISFREDKENLLYIYRKIKSEQLQYEDNIQKESIASVDSILPLHFIQSHIDVPCSVSREIGPHCLTDHEMIAKTKPFEFVWTHCINAKLGIINLTTKDRKGIFFASSHLPIFYNYCTEHMKCLEGHQYLISSISVDQSGQWLTTADDNKDGCVIIWDSFELKPVYTLFSIYSVSGVMLAKLSPSAKYLVTIGMRHEGKYSVDFWLWTLGKDNPDDAFEVDKNYGVPVDVCFNPNMEEFIMVIFKKQVVFAVWETENAKLNKSRIPQIANQNKVGYLTAGTYLNHCHECYACSSKGCVLVFGSALYNKPYKESNLDNVKIFRTAIKISRRQIRSCAATDRTLVIGDEDGRILFFDKTVRILYWLKDFSLGPIVSISFNKMPKFKKEDESMIYTGKPNSRDVFECEFADVSDELEIIYKKDLPKDTSLTNDPFLVNDFFIATADNNVHAIDMLHNKCASLFLMTDDNVSAIDVHDELPYIVVGYANGRLQLINYKENELLCTTVLPKTENSTSISCLKYGYGSLHLVCGRENGEIFILETILLKPKTDVPFRPTPDKVVKIIFSKNNKQFAYYDRDAVVVLFVFDKESFEWKFMEKIKSHYDVINDIIFMPSHRKDVLFTIGRDRHLVEYNTDEINDEISFGIVYRERIEQTAIPLTFLYWYEKKENKKSKHLLVADDEHKFKMLNPKTKIPTSVILAPAFGCFKNQIITKMAIVPETKARYMVFLTGKYLGLHLMLPDGNPYKYTGCLGHPSNVSDFVLSPDGAYLFTFGTDDHCLFKWKVKTKAVELMHLMGGKELQPYYCLIEGGKNGWLFQEIKDLFYYMQSLQNENVELPRKVSDSINITDIPELVRTCGLYPSEFELENMMIDVKYRHYDESGLFNDDINFIDFVKLFCNHKPVYGYSIEKLKTAFETIEENLDLDPGDGISRDDFTAVLSCTGECINTSNLMKLLQTLTRSNLPGDNFDFLPKEITFEKFYEEILGLNKG